MNNTVTFKDIIDRIIELSQRDKKSIQEKALKITEECGELAEAVLSHTGAHGCQYKNKTEGHIIEETTDIITVAFSLLSDLGKTYQSCLTVADEWDICEIWSKKLDKWEEKLNEDQNTTT